MSILLLSITIAFLPLLILGLRYRQEVRKKAGVRPNEAVLTLAGPSGAVNQGDVFPVTLSLNTGGRNVFGVDVILDFNSANLKLVGITPNTSTNFKVFPPLVTGTENFAILTPEFIAQANASNKIEFGAVSYNFALDGGAGYDPYNYPVNGSNVLLATLQFEALAASGNQMIYLNFDPSHEGVSGQSCAANPNQESCDCNVILVDRPAGVVDDILGTANPLTISIGTAEDCPWHICGDADCETSQHGYYDVDMNDFGLFASEYNGNDVPGLDADFDGSGSIDMNDFGLFANGYLCRGTTCESGPWCIGILE